MNLILATEANAFNHVYLLYMRMMLVIWFLANSLNCPAGQTRALTMAWQQRVSRIWAGQRDYFVARAEDMEACKLSIPHFAIQGPCRECTYNTTLCRYGPGAHFYSSNDCRWKEGEGFAQFNILTKKTGGV